MIHVHPPAQPALPPAPIDEIDRLRESAARTKVKDISPETASQMLKTLMGLPEPEGSSKYIVDVERCDGSWNTHVIMADHAGTAVSIAVQRERQKGHALSGELRVCKA